ncbi:MAG TPA: ATP-binding protein [Polyangiaceae bacterium]|nr:ATP-binding protein [Polyangiaceae bacterium]
MHKSNDPQMVTADRARAVSELRSSISARTWHGFAGAAGAVAAATLISVVLFGRTSLSNVAIVYVLCIVLVSLRYSYRPALFAAVLSALLLDFAFTQPYWRLSIADPREGVTIAVMFIAGVIIASLTKRVRDQATLAQRRETVTSLLYAMSRDLADTVGIELMLHVAKLHLHQAFGAPIAILMPDSTGMLANAHNDARTFELSSSDREAAEWAWRQQRNAGWGTDTSPQADALFLPLGGSLGRVGALGIKLAGVQPLDPWQLQLLRTFAAQLGSALERAQLAETAQRAQIQIQAERMRSSLLSSVSHDLRTPLGVITGAAGTLLEHEQYLAPEARHDLLESVHEQAERLNRLVANLLDMTKLASGTLQPQKEWHPLDELVGVAMNQVEHHLGGREVKIALPPDLPPLPVDAILMEQVLINLLENALKYTPPESGLEITARRAEEAVEVAIADRGPGVPLGEHLQVFDKFYRFNPNRSVGGAGLGLAICRGMVEAHGGRIWVEDREGGGAVFRFTIPIEEGPSPVAA